MSAPGVADDECGYCSGGPAGPNPDCPHHGAQLDTLPISGDDAVHAAAIAAHRRLGAEPNRDWIATTIANAVVTALYPRIAAAEAEVERLRAVVECVKADLAYERGKVSVYEAEIEQRAGEHGDTIDAFEDRYMALRSRLAAAERVCEVAAKRLKHYIDMPLADALDAWRAVRDGDQ